MRKRKSIPVNSFEDEGGSGFWINKINFEELPPLEDWWQSERHDRHTFFLLEHGSVSLEIDFQQHNVFAPALIYMHPNQVHRIIGFKDLKVFTWAMQEEKMNAEYVKLLEEIIPAGPVDLNSTNYTLLAEGVSFCLKLTNREKGLLAYALLRDQFNALTGIVLSLYLEQRAPILWIMQN